MISAIIYIFLKADDERVLIVIGVVLSADILRK